MSYLFTILYFLITSNLVLLLLFKLGFGKKIDKNTLLFFSYGVGPFIFALIFYALIWLFPNKPNLFYVYILTGFSFITFIFGRRNWIDAKKIYDELWSNIQHEIKRLPKVLLVISLVFIGLYVIQLFAFPVINNDSALYLSQSEAVYEYKDTAWQKMPNVKINENGNYTYDYSIRPGIPSIISSIYLYIGQGRYDYFAFRFLISYFYLLLFFLFLYCIKKISVELSLNTNNNLSFGIVFFVFFWDLTRDLIFSAKEPIIYYLALLSILLVSTMITRKNDNWEKKVMLGIVLGINSFVNLHGIIIECVILVLYFIFSRQRMLNKIISCVLIFLISLFIGGGEFITTFVFVFAESLGFTEPPVRHTDIVAISQIKIQAYNILDVYLKGKFQILTKVGDFGFYFWIFLLVLAKFFKKIIKSPFLRIILIFMVIYYVVVIDPFSLNKNPISIVLWSSGKYTALLVFFGMIVSSIFINSFLNWLARIIIKNKTILQLIGLALLSVIVILRLRIIDLGTKLLLLTIPIFKEASFYRSAVERFYIVLLISIFLFVATLIFLKRKWQKRQVTYFLNVFLVFIILGPFFMTTVGKVPLYKTLSFIGKNQVEILDSTYYEGDIFKAYFLAQKVLPKNTIVGTDFNELSLYNRGNFILVPSSSKNYIYSISDKCKEGDESLYNFNGIKLCKAYKK